jgi:hypothetical protein
VLFLLELRQDVAKRGFFRRGSLLVDGRFDRIGVTHEDSGILTILA